MPDIIEPSVIKTVFCDHLWIWGLVLDFVTEGAFEGDRTVVPISVFEVVKISYLLKLGF